MTEREKIVEWLREGRARERFSDLGKEMMDVMADAIEAGEHLRKPEPTIPASEHMRKGNLGH